MKSRSTVFCHVTTRTKTNNLTVHAHTLIAPKWSISHLCFQFAEDSQVEMKNRPSQWFTALCCRSSLSTHWNFSPPRLFMHTFQQGSGINITTKGMACIRGHAFFPPSWKCYLNLDILIKSYIDLNIMTEKRYLCSLQQSDTSQHFGLQKIKLVLYDCVTVNPKKRLDFVVWCHKERHANQFSHAQSVLQLH